MKFTHVSHTPYTHTLKVILYSVLKLGGQLLTKVNQTPGVVGKTEDEAGVPSGTHFKEKKTSL
jgi:hypothetical protein